MSVRYFTNADGSVLPEVGFAGGMMSVVSTKTREQVLMKNAHCLYKVSGALYVGKDQALHRVAWYQSLAEAVVDFFTRGSASKARIAQVQEVAFQTLISISERLKNLEEACRKCTRGGCNVQPQWTQEHKDPLFSPLGNYYQKPWNKDPKLESFEKLGEKVLTRFRRPFEDREIRDLAFDIEKRACNLRRAHNLVIRRENISFLRRVFSSLVQLPASLACRISGCFRKAV
jgi:hypothetical protein